MEIKIDKNYSYLDKEYKVIKALGKGAQGEVKMI